MLPGDKPFNVPARTPDPYVHLDNRGLVLFDGVRGVMFQANSLPWVAETLGLIAEEKRATRRQGDHVFGGFTSEDGTSATLYAGHADNLATVEVPFDALGALREQLGRR